MGMKLRKWYETIKGVWNYERGMKVRKGYETTKGVWKYKRGIKLRNGYETTKGVWNYKNVMKLWKGNEIMKREWSYERGMKLRKGSETTKREWSYEIDEFGFHTPKCHSSLPKITITNKKYFLNQNIKLLEIRKKLYDANNGHGSIYCFLCSQREQNEMETKKEEKFLWEGKVNFYWIFSLHFLLFLFSQNIFFPFSVAVLPISFVFFYGVRNCGVVRENVLSPVGEGFVEETLIKRVKIRE